MSRFVALALSPLLLSAATQLVDIRSSRVLQSSSAHVAARPGSAIKPFVVVALIEARVLPAKAEYHCPGKLTIGGRSFACMHPAVVQAMDASVALAYSCNNYIAHYAALLPPGALERTLTRYGLSTTPAPRELIALGEEGIQVTPAQLAEAYRRLALNPPAPVLQGLRDCLRYGTGQLAAISGFAVAGKTGTSTLAGRHGSVAWFAGFAPADAPEIAFAVMTPEGSGGGDAAPLARATLQKWLGRENELSVETNDGLRTLSLDEYTAGVLGGEAAGLKSAEALKAMAVAARTYAVKFRGRHREEGFDFCDRQHCQSFHPEAVTDAIRAAVDATSGELLWREGSLAETLYTQDCGGVNDPYCPRTPWTSTLRPVEIARALREAGLRQPAKLDLRITRRDSSGRAQELDLGGGVAISASSFRFAIGRALGFSKLPSDLYQVSGFTFTGRGAGNGVGLCQLGADRMPGSYRDILAFYYPGAVVGLSASGIHWTRLAGERIELWTTAPARDREWIGVAERLLADAESTTGMQLDAHPQLRLYPTVAMFRDATGEPAWNAASTKGRIIRMQPAGLNRAVLKHELLHLLIESRARAGLPWWFREGLALSLAGGAPPDSKAYADARRRTDDCIARYGRGAVLGWVAAGLPPELKNASASQPVTARQ